MRMESFILIGRYINAEVRQLLILLFKWEVGASMSDVFPAVPRRPKGIRKN